MLQFTHRSAIYEGEYQLSPARRATAPITQTVARWRRQAKRWRRGDAPSLPPFVCCPPAPVRCGRDSRRRERECVGVLYQITIVITPARQAIDPLPRAKQNNVAPRCQCVLGYTVGSQ